MKNLTKEEKALIIEALGVASDAYTKVHEELCSLKNVPYNKNEQEEAMAAKFYYKKSCEFHDLAYKIEKGGEG